MIQVPSDLLRDMANYVKDATPALEKLSRLDTELTKHAEVTVDALIKQGLLSPALRADRIKAYVENPGQALVDLEKTASCVQHSTIGGPSENPSEAGESSGDYFKRRMIG
jgi:hypothetical protein